jgi:para-aminobenzoate synthetase component 1
MGRPHDVGSCEDAGVHRLVRRALAGDAPVAVVVRRLAKRARSRGLPPPAALTGEWFGSAAVIAPSVRVDAVPPADAFTLLDRIGPLRGAPGSAVGGGWVGYLGYGLTDPGRWPRRLPLAAWGWADHVLRLDRSGRWWFEALAGADDPGLDALVNELAAIVAGGGGPEPICRATEVCCPDRERHEQAILACQEAIRAGEIYQANICTRFDLTLSGRPVDAFAAGIVRYEPARAAFVAGRWGALASLSPELFLERHGSLVRSAPIKGTAPRHGDPLDTVHRAALLASTKDRAENVMIVDLVRNDLGRMCATGTVTVPQLLTVRPAPGVWHLVSTVAGRLRPGVPDSALLAAVFPPGSVTGVPKLRALELIAELESAPREAYCGAIGMASPVAGLELNVAIRTIEVAPDGRAWLGVGGGITIDSEPPDEWAECQAKAAPLLALLTRPLLLWPAFVLAIVLAMLVPAVQRGVVELPPGHTVLARHRGGRVLEPLPRGNPAQHLGHQLVHWGRFGRRRGSKHHGDLTARRPFCDLLHKCGEGAAQHLLVQFGQLAAHCRPSLVAKNVDGVGQAGREPVRCLEEHHTARLAGQACQPAPPLASPAGCEPLEAEPLRGQPGQRERRHHGRWARQARHRQSCLYTRVHQPVARIGDGWHARVGEHQHGLAGSHGVQ